MSTGGPRRLERGIAPAQLALVAGWVVAALLRIEDLGWQLTVGDEVHTLSAVLRQDTSYISTHNHLPGATVDYSIPLALWYLLLTRTVGLGEWGMRLPMVATGVALVVLGSLAAWRAMGRFEGVVMSFWLATSPLLVFHSRFARPYGIAACLVLVAFLACCQWRRTGRTRSAWVAACSGAVALYFSLTAAPTVLVLWGAVVLAAAARGRFGAGFRAMLVGSLIAAVLLAPSAAAHGEFVMGVGGRSTPTWATWWGSLRMLLGSQNDVVVAGLLLLTLLGAAIAARRMPLELAAVAAMLVGQVAMLYTVRPYAVSCPTIATRYALVAGAPVLLLTCLGTCTAARWLGLAAGRPLVVAPAVTTLVMLVTLATGWLPREYVATHVDTSNMFDAVRTPAVPVANIPGFYRDLAAAGERVTVAEWPWLPQWRQYQDVHGQRVVVVTAEREAPGVRFRTTHHVETVLAGTAAFDYLIVHKDPLREWAHVTTGAEPAEIRTPDARATRAAMVSALAACRHSKALEQLAEEKWIVVFRRL